MKNFALIMAGGKGTRLWPESTSERPKQYLNLIGNKSLLAQTIERFEGLCQNQDRFIITTEEQFDLCAQESKGHVPQKNIILEPMGRNTAPCILLGLHTLIEDNKANEQDLVAIVPADHVILNQKGFQQTLKGAFDLAHDQQGIVTIGIRPHFPHTGFGYIHRSENLGEGQFKVSSFREKPNQDTAEAYLKSGEYFWNAGMFVAPLGVLLQEFKIHAPDIIQHYSNIKKEYDRLPSTSIDYAIMEKSTNVYVVEAQFDWNDLGSWDALASIVEKKDGNYWVKAEKTHVLDAFDNIVYAPEQEVALLGVRDLVIVSNKKRLVVMPATRAQEIKKIVEDL